MCRFWSFTRANIRCIVITTSETIRFVRGDIIDTLLLSFLTSGAVYFDLRTFKIPNILCLGGIIFGLLYRLILLDYRGVGIGVLGVVLPVVICFLLFAFRIIGAGDIKLMSAIGAFVGFRIIHIIALTFILTALYAAMLLLYRGIRSYILAIENGMANKDFSQGTRVHLSVPIMIATMILQFVNM